jgi:serine O-acetyltransferase
MNEFFAAAAADIERCRNHDTRSPRYTLAVIWHEVGLQAVLVYRFGRMLRSGQRNVGVWPLLPFGWLLYALAAVVMRRCYGIRLALSAEIGKGFWIVHFGGIEVVNCRIGQRCTLGQQTKVGREGDPDGPQIGDAVMIGVHAQIMGPTRVGSSVTIAPGARVTLNVPENSLVVGDPARVVFRGYRNAAILPATPQQPRAA